MDDSYIIDMYDECCICLDNLIDNINTIKCGHKFHKHCIETWFKTSNSVKCPLCQKKILTRSMQLSNRINNPEQFIEYKKIECYILVIIIIILLVIINIT